MRTVETDSGQGIHRRAFATRFAPGRLAGLRPVGFGFAVSCYPAPARPGVSRGNETVSRGRARAARASRYGRGARAAQLRGGRRGAVRPSVPGALPLAGAAVSPRRSPATGPGRDLLSDEQRPLIGPAAGLTAKYAANAALEVRTASSTAPRAGARPAARSRPLALTPRRKIIHITAKPTPIGQHKTCMCGAT